MYVACLMAGMSSRLLPLTKSDHKAMLKVGKQRMIDVQMEALSLAGVETFSFVVGHGATRLAQHLLRRYSSAAMSIINNTHFVDRNLDWSAYLGLSSRQDDVMYYEGDLIVPPDLVRQMLTDTADVCVAMDPAGKSVRVDTRITQRPDHTYELIFVERGSLDISPESNVDGEFVCLVKLSNRAREYVVKRLGAVSYAGPMMLYQVFNDVFQRYPTSVISTAGRPWMEVDNKEDLRRARHIAKQIMELPSKDTSCPDQQLRRKSLP